MSINVLFFYLYYANLEQMIFTKLNDKIKKQEKTMLEMSQKVRKYLGVFSLSCIIITSFLFVVAIMVALFIIITGSQISLASPNILSSLTSLVLCTIWALLSFFARLEMIADECGKNFRYVNIANIVCWLLIFAPIAIFNLWPYVIFSLLSNFGIMSIPIMISFASSPVIDLLDLQYQRKHYQEKN